MPMPFPLDHRSLSTTFAGPVPPTGQSTRYQGPPTGLFNYVQNQQQNLAANRAAYDQVAQQMDQQERNYQLRKQNSDALLKQNQSALSGLIPKQRPMPIINDPNDLRGNTSPLGYRGVNSPGILTGLAQGPAYQASPIGQTREQIQWLQRGNRYLPAPGSYSPNYGEGEVTLPSGTVARRTPNDGASAYGTAMISNPAFEKGNSGQVNWKAVLDSRRQRQQDAIQQRNQARAEQLMTAGLLQQLMQFAKTGQSPLATPAPVVDKMGNVIQGSPVTNAQNAYKGIMGAEYGTPSTQEAPAARSIIPSGPNDLADQLESGTGPIPETFSGIGRLWSMFLDTMGFGGPNSTLIGTNPSPENGFINGQSYGGGKFKIPPAYKKPSYSGSTGWGDGNFYGQQ